MATEVPTDNVPIWQANQPAAPEFSPGSPLRAIQDRGSVRIAVLSDLPGFAWKDPETARRSGLDIEIAKFMVQGIFGGTLNQALNHIEFVDITAAQREFSCQDDACDFVVSAFAVTESRRRNVDFTDPYYGTSLATVIRSEEPNPDILKARIAVVEGSTGLEFVRKNDLGGRVLTFENASEIPAAVASGNADVGIIMSAVGDNLIQANHLPVKRSTRSLVFDTWAIGVRKGNVALRDFFDQRLQVMVEPSVTPLRPMTGQ